MTELAFKKVLEFELPLEDLPKDVVDMIEGGPLSRPMTERGVHLVEVLEQNEKEAKVVHPLQEEEMAEVKEASLLGFFLIYEIVLFNFKHILQQGLLCATGE